MNPPNREVALFSAALELPASQREAYLDKACADDPALRQRLDALLGVHEKAITFLENPPPGTHEDPKVPTATLRLTSLPSEKPGDRIGRYKLLQPIGEGGCGVVYMAEQEEPVRRRVALKVIKLGMDTKQVIARFEAERQALAMMDHANIAKVLDAGATETGRPYFVMELVRGIKITDYCDENNLSTKERLELFIQVCHAVQHAHQKGIIHRDLKPSNILVAKPDPDSAGVPKVIDFGIAKATQGRLTDQTLFTAFEQFIGTPAYMSPEQAELTMQDVDTRTDIYSLGVLLYELLIGRTPFDAQELLASGLDAMRRTIREQEPLRPSTRLSTMLESELTTTAKHRRIEPPKLVHLVRGDLDWIVMKALEKDRARRYETANGLAMDILRHLHCEPVIARPPSHLYEFQKTVRRHKFGFAAAAAVGGALSIGLAVSMSLLAQEKAARQRATAAEREQASLRLQADQARTRAETGERKAETEAARSAQVAQFLKDTLRAVGPKVAMGRDTQLLREVLDSTARRVNTELTNQPEVRAELLVTVGDTYLQLGEHDDAAAAVREAVHLRRLTFGETNELVAAALHSLARILVNRRGPNDFAQAETLVRQALAMQRQLLGETNQDVANSLAILAAALQNQGKLTDSVTIHRQVLAMQRTLTGEDHPAVASTLNNLGSALIGQHKFAEAEEAIREALRIQQQVFGLEHPDIGDSLMNLGRVLSAQHRLADATSAYREALAMHRKFNKSRRVGDSLDNLFNLLMEQKELSEVEALLREVLEMSQKDAQFWEKCLYPKAQLKGAIQRYVYLCEKATPARQAAEWKKRLGELVTQSIPARDPAASTNHIDLSYFYNASLTEPWHGPGGSDLSELPRGVQTFAGVQFDVRGLIQVAVPAWGYPEEVRGIPIHRACRRLHFLHAAIGQNPDGAKIGSYIAHRASGTQSEVPLILGQSLGDWWVQPNEQHKTFTIAWAGQNAGSRQAGKSIRLFKSTWENPTPGEIISTIDFIGFQKQPAPFLVAITAEP